MREANVIDGDNLIKFAHYGDFVDGFIDLIDPSGVNVVIEEYPEFGHKMRLWMLFKIVNEVEPITGQLTLPTSIYHTIKRKVSLHVN